VLNTQIMAAIDEERAGVMILRAWAEPDHEDRLRVRIIQLTQGESVGPVVQACTSIDEVCAAIRAWLLGLESM
jgi:hypothetical protein